MKIDRIVVRMFPHAASVFHRRSAVCSIGLLATLVMVGWPWEARADPRCPDGYKVVFDEHDDSEISDEEGLICLPADRPLDGDYYDGSVAIWHFWGSIAYADPGSDLSATWNYDNRKAAETGALKSCRARLQSKGVKGKCRLPGAWYNGDGVVAAGDGNRLFPGSSPDDALGTCQRVTTNCKISWTVPSRGGADKPG